MAEEADFPAGDPGIEERRFVAQMKATDEAQIGKLAEQCQSFARVDAVVVQPPAGISISVLQAATRYTCTSAGIPCAPRSRKDSRSTNVAALTDATKSRIERA